MKKPEWCWWCGQHVYRCQCSSLRYLALICLFLPLCGASCGDQPAVDQNVYDHILQTRQDWLSQGLPDINTGCKNYMIRMHVTYLPQDALQTTCNLHEELYGCLQGNDIYVVDTAQNTVRNDYIVEHELRHWFGGCTPLGVDANHSNDAQWYPYKGWDVRQDVP